MGSPRWPRRRGPGRRGREKWRCQRSRCSKRRLASARRARTPKRTLSSTRVPVRMPRSASAACTRSPSGRALSRPAVSMTPFSIRWSSNRWPAGRRRRRPGGHVAGRVDALDGGGQTGVGEDDAARAELHAHVFEAQPVCGRRPPGSHQQPLDHHGIGQSPGSTVPAQDPVGARAPVSKGLHSCHTDVASHMHAAVLEGCPHRRRRLGLLRRKQLGPLFEQGDLDSQEGEGLGQLAAGGPAADDAERPRGVGQVEHGLVGEGLGLGQARNVVGKRGLRAGGHHDAARRDAPLPHRHRVVGGQAGPSLDHGDPPAAQHVGRLGGRDALDGGAHPGHGIGEAQAVAGRGQQRLGRHAAGEGAVPSRSLIGDQGHIGSGPERGPHRAQPGRAPADHDQVVVHHPAPLHLQERMGIGFSCGPRRGRPGTRPPARPRRRDRPPPASG